jgi:hypothetical protein
MLDCLTVKNASDWMPEDWTWMDDSAIFIIGFLTSILPSVYTTCHTYFKNKKFDKFFQVWSLPDLK